MSLQKKLEAEYAKGFTQACEFWERALDRTKGVGDRTKDKLRHSLHEQVAEIYKRKHAERCVKSANDASANVEYKLKNNH